MWCITNPLNSLLQICPKFFKVRQPQKCKALVWLPRLGQLLLGFLHQRKTPQRIELIHRKMNTFQVGRHCHLGWLHFKRRDCSTGTRFTSSRHNLYGVISAAALITSPESVADALAFCSYYIFNVLFY